MQVKGVIQEPTIQTHFSISINQQTLLIIRDLQTNLSPRKPVMSQNNQSQIQNCMRTFIQAVCEQKLLQFQMNILAQIKKIITKNPNNYYHPYYGSVTFTHVYQFIIQSLSHQHLSQILPFLLHVLSLMAKYWIYTSENLWELYQGILSLFQQRAYCGENCFKFLTVLVETMQDQDKITHWEQTTFDHHNNCTTIKTQRSALQNYFVYHILNQLVAFANIFLDRSVIRNQQAQNASGTNKKKHGQQEDSKIGDSQGRSHSITKSLQNSNSQPSQPDCQLYKIVEEQSVILSILSLFRACLSYDFAYVTRHEQQAEYEPHKSPIIIPTKYSKFCKFSQYDIFLKSENTTQMLNYLYLVSNSYQLKLQILKILQSMARIHFRYFKNKTYHKLHLEEIGYVVGNLMTGLDINEGLGKSIHGKSGAIKSQNDKISLALSLCQIVNILLYHQPTFYLVENSLIQLIFGNLETFILDQLLQPDYFQLSLEEEQSSGVSKQDLLLLLQTFMGYLPKLKELVKNYLHSNDLLLEKVNQMFIKIGQRFLKVLCLEKSSQNLLRNKQDSKMKMERNWKAKESDSSASDKRTPMAIPEQSFPNEAEFQDQSNPMIQTSQNQLLSALYSRTIEQDEKQETQTHCNPIITEKINSGKQMNMNKTQLSHLQKIQKTRQASGFLQTIVQESGSVEHIRNIITIFRVYSPRHTYFQQFFFSKRTSSSLSYISEKSFSNGLNEDVSVFSIDKMLGYGQKWITTWVCAFQHHFNFTGGHCRDAQVWQLQIHNKFMIELIEDLNYGIKIYLQAQSISQQGFCKEYGKCLLTALLFYTDKVTFDSKIGVLQHNQLFDFDTELVFDWIVIDTFRISKDIQEISQKLTIVTPLLEMIQKVNYQRWVKDKIDKCQISVSELRSKYLRGIRQFLVQILELYIKKPFIKQIQSISKILVIKLRFLQESEDSNSNKQDEGWLVQLQNLIFMDPLFLLTLLEESTSNLVWRSKRWHQSIYYKIRDISVKLFDKNNFFTQNIANLSTYGDKSFVASRFACLTSSLVKFIQIQRRLGQSQIFKTSILQLFNIFNDFGYRLLCQDGISNCCCHQFVIPLLQLTNELNFISRCISYFPSFISVFKNHQKCLSQYPTSALLNLMHTFISIIMRFNNIQFFSQQCKEFTNQNRHNSVLSFLAEYYVWMLKILQLSRKIYGQYNDDLVKIEREVIELGMSGYRQHQIYKKSFNGILSTLQLTLFSVQNQIKLTRQQIYSQAVNHYVSQNKKYIMLSILQYLYAKFFDYLQDKSINLFCSSYQGQTQSYLKIDFAISVFYTYHHIFEIFYMNQLWVLEYVVQNKVIFDAIKYICQMGVNWVVRRLELWDKDQSQGLQIRYQAMSPPSKKNYEDELYTEYRTKSEIESQNKNGGTKEANIEGLEEQLPDLEKGNQKQSQIQDRDDKETKNQQQEIQKIEDRTFLHSQTTNFLNQQFPYTQHEQSRND